MLSVMSTQVRENTIAGSLFVRGRGAGIIGLSVVVIVSILVVCMHILFHTGVRVHMIAGFVNVRAGGYVVITLFVSDIAVDAVEVTLLYQDICCPAV
jgi:hypothetical protein